VVRVGGVLDPEDETDRQNCKECGHEFCFECK
jgi:hypothetical protein